MNKYNIVWIVVDSVRNYHSFDDRSRLEIMDKFSNEGVEFKNVVTSAPSTVMSISAMMTSIPAYFIGRNYNDFRFDNKFFFSLSSILKSHGWTSRALLMHPDIREKLTVFDLIEKKFWPKNFSHKNWWDNQKIFSLLKNSLEIDSKSKRINPVFWFLDFNCRKDPQTSKIVEDSIQLFHQYNYIHNNTIFVLCSDHGYPDPKTGINPEYLKKNKLTHDMFMTDDNIMIPLILSYPKCIKGKKIETLCSSLDIMPTLLDILKIKVNKKIKDNWHGQSLLKLTNNLLSKNSRLYNRKVRVDARFLGQENRITAIKNKTNKLILYHDQNKYELFKINSNKRKEEKINIDNNQKIFKNLFDEFLKIENQALKFQTQYAIYKLEKKLKKYKNTKNILILYNQISGANEVLKHALIKIFPNSNIALQDIKTIDLNFYNKQKNDFLFFLCNRSVSIKKLLSKINYKKIFFIDVNMNISIKSGMILRFLKTIYLNRKFYYQEPTLIFWKIMQSLRLVCKKIL